jgi:hypothetical protein
MGMNPGLLLIDSQLLKVPSQRTAVILALRAKQC